METCNAMKHVVEEITVIDKQVELLYIEGTKKEQGSGKQLNGFGYI